VILQSATTGSGGEGAFSNLVVLCFSCTNDDANLQASLLILTEHNQPGSQNGELTWCG
jgi:hypothetical protein